MDSSRSAKDIEAEIAAAASAIGGVKTEKSMDQPKEEAKSALTVAAERKRGTAEEDTSKQEVKPAPVIEVPKKTVKTSANKPKKSKRKTATKKITKKVTAKKPAKETVDEQPVKLQSGAVKVNIFPKSVVAKTDGKSGRSTSLNRHGKKLTPIGDVRKLKKAEKDAIPKHKPLSPDAIAVKVIPKKKKPIKAKVNQKPYKVIKKAPPSELVQKPEPQETVVKVKPVEPQPAPAPVPEIHKPQPVKRTPHAARLYDTRTYHMPLSVDHHHRRAIMPIWGRILVVMIGLVAASFTALMSGFIEL